MSDDRSATSRFLAYVLRHQPSAAGIVLDSEGWADVDALLAALAARGRPLDLAGLQRVVDGGGKRRFELRDGRIRALQGHSADVDLGLDPVPPPAVLYHGTVERFLARIMTDGLLPRGRRHVHLSPDVATARAVGARRGDPVVLRIDATGLHREGGVFYRADNGVWLTGAIPPRWLSRLDD